MKKLIKIIFIILISYISLLNITYGNNYTNKKYNINKETINTSTLLLKHIYNLKKEIYLFESKLDLINNKNIKGWLNDLEKIKKGLLIIKSNKISNLKANILIKVIINKLKYININLKSYLKTKLKDNQNKIKKLKLKYNFIINNLVDKLTLGIKKVKYNLNKKRNLTSKDKALLYHLQKLKIFTINLSHYSKKTFYSIKGFKNFLLKNLQGISNEIKELKKIIK